MVVVVVVVLVALDMSGHPFKIPELQEMDEKALAGCPSTTPRCEHMQLNKAVCLHAVSPGVFKQMAFGNLHPQAA